MNLEIYERLYPYFAKTLCQQLDEPVANYAAHVLSERFTARGVNVPILDMNVHDVTDTLTTIETLKEDRQDKLAALVGKAQGDYFLAMLGVFPERYIARQLKKNAPPLKFYDAIAAHVYGLAIRIANDNEREVIEHLSQPSEFRKTRRGISKVICINSNDPQLTIERLLNETIH